jgi:hypothetical protein
MRESHQHLDEWLEAVQNEIDRMNRIPKFVASTTLRETTWNATVIDGDVATFVDDLKRKSGQNLLKYGNGPAVVQAHQFDDIAGVLVVLNLARAGPSCT